MRALSVLVLALTLSGCALRPRYAEFVGKETVGPVKLQLVEKKTGLGIPGALVEVGESRGKVTVRTDGEGFFLLPVDKRLLDDNALIVVNVPAGTGRTQVVAASTVLLGTPAPPLEASDAGTSTY